MSHQTASFLCKGKQKRAKQLNYFALFYVVWGILFSLVASGMNTSEL
jgi:hypothetical protein